MSSPGRGIPVLGTGTDSGGPRTPHWELRRCPLGFQRVWRRKMCSSNMSTLLASACRYWAPAPLPPAGRSQDRKAKWDCWDRRSRKRSRVREEFKGGKTAGAGLPVHLKLNWNYGICVDVWNHEEPCRLLNVFYPEYDGVDSCTQLWGTELGVGRVNVT